MRFPIQRPPSTCIAVGRSATRRRRIDPIYSAANFSCLSFVPFRASSDCMAHRCVILAHRYTSGMRCWGRDRAPPGVRHETRDRDRRPPNAVKNNRADGGVIGGLSWMGSPVSRFRQWTFPVASWSVGPPQKNVSRSPATTRIFHLHYKSGPQSGRDHLLLVRVWL